MGGNDSIISTDNELDSVNCGIGVDTLHADDGDSYGACESVTLH
jgi:hypothetical protein